MTKVKQLPRLFWQGSVRAPWHCVVGAEAGEWRAASRSVGGWSHSIRESPLTVTLLVVELLCGEDWSGASLRGERSCSDHSLTHTTTLTVGTHTPAELHVTSCLVFLNAEGARV